MKKLELDQRFYNIFFKILEPETRVLPKNRFLLTFYFHMLWFFLAQESGTYVLGFNEKIKKPRIKAGFYEVSKPSLPLSLYRISLQFFASLTTVQSATNCTCSRVVKRFHRNPPYRQYLIPPKL